jgi:uncharacterized protein YcbK (DUF882 family)
MITRPAVCIAAGLALMACGQAHEPPGPAPSSSPLKSAAPAAHTPEPTPAAVCDALGQALHAAQIKAAREARRHTPAGRVATQLETAAIDTVDRIQKAHMPTALWNARQSVALGLFSADLVGHYTLPEGPTVDEAARQKALARRKTLAPGELVFSYQKSGEQFRLQVYDAEGRMRPEAYRAFVRALWAPGEHGRFGESLWIAQHPRLLAMLYITAHFFDEPIEIISAFRPPRGKARSNHARGRAIDFRVRGIKRRRLLRYLDQSFSRVGVGWYPNSTFIHLDTRRAPYYWTDRSKPGQRQRVRKRKPSKPARGNSDPTAKTLHISQKRLYTK